MEATAFSELATWITGEGLAGRAETVMMAGLCERLVAAGVPLARGLCIIDTLHPIYEGHAVRWRRDEAETTLIEYGRTDSGAAGDSWRRSTFYRLFTTGETLLRRRLTAETVAEFPGLASEVEAGLTDYVALFRRFPAEGVIGEMDGFFVNWITDHPDGFADGHIENFERLMPFLALAMKAASLARIAETLAVTYLGRDAGRLVLSGRIGRGVAERIDTVLWFSDLRGYTTITDTADPEQIIPLLNDYAEAVVSTVHEYGGDVLKLIGDGVLAIFRADDRAHACRAAIGAALKARRRVAKLNVRRTGDGLPTTQIYLGLHAGEVFFGNIGSQERLDFTVVGPAVNEVSRIAAMCRSVDRPLLVSATFAAALGETGPRLACVGRFALRGVSRSQELFTIDEDSSEAA